MARTYRKNVRWYFKFRGQFYNPYNDKTVQGEARDYINYHWRYPFRDELWGASRGKRQEVLVGDRDNLPRLHMGGPTRRMISRIDRARLAAALRFDMQFDPEDANDDLGKPAFDPWDFD